MPGACQLRLAVALPATATTLVGAAGGTGTGGGPDTAAKTTVAINQVVWAPVPAAAAGVSPVFTTRSCARSSMSVTGEALVRRVNPAPGVGWRRIRSRRRSRQQATRPRSRRWSARRRPCPPPRSCRWHLTARRPPRHEHRGQPGVLEHDGGDIVGGGRGDADRRLHAAAPADDRAPHAHLGAVGCHESGHLDVAVPGRAARRGHCRVRRTPDPGLHYDPVADGHVRPERDVELGHGPAVAGDLLGERRRTGGMCWEIDHPDGGINSATAMASRAFIDPFSPWPAGWTLRQWLRRVVGDSSVG